MPRSTTGPGCLALPLRSRETTTCLYFASQRGNLSRSAVRGPVVPSWPLARHRLGEAEPLRAAAGGREPHGVGLVALVLRHLGALERERELALRGVERHHAGGLRPVDALERDLADLLRRRARRGGGGRGGGLDFGARPSSSPLNTNSASTTTTIASTRAADQQRAAEPGGGGGGRALGLRGGDGPRGPRAGAAGGARAWPARQRQPPADRPLRSAGPRLRGSLRSARGQVGHLADVLEAAAHRLRPRARGGVVAQQLARSPGAACRSAGRAGSRRSGRSCRRAARRPAPAR